MITRRFLRLVSQIANQALVSALWTLSTLMTIAFGKRFWKKKKEKKRRFHSNVSGVVKVIIKKSVTFHTSLPIPCHITKTLILLKGPKGRCLIVPTRSIIINMPSENDASTVESNCSSTSRSIAIEWNLDWFIQLSGVDVRLRYFAWSVYYTARSVR